MPLLKILGHLERETFDAPPIFKTEERKKFFTLPAGLNLARETLRTSTNQVFFILQAGYFRDRHRFFENQFRPADIAFVADRCKVPADQISISNYPKQTLLRHQQLIVDYFGFHKSGENNQNQIEYEVERLVRLVVRPSHIFWEIVSYFRQMKIVVPSYNRLAVIISRQLQNYEKQLQIIVAEKLNDRQKQLLDALLEKEPAEKNPTAEDSAAPDFRFRLTRLKQIFQTNKPADIKANLADWQTLQTIYRECGELIAELHLSPAAVRYYANFVQHARVLQLTRRNQNETYLYLLAFIAFQTFRRQDLLIDTLLQSVQNTTNSAVSEQRVKYFRERHEKRQQLSVCLQSLQKEVLPAFTDIERILAGQNFNDREKLGLIEKTLAASLPERQQVEKQIKQLQYETGDERDERDYYDALQGKSLKLQQRASAIVRQLRVDENNINPALFDALRHFQSKSGSIEKNAPQGFLTVKEKSFLKNPDGKFSASLYKVLLFQKIAAGIKSGAVNFEQSHKYRSLDDYLIPAQKWQTETAELLSSGDLERFVKFPPLLEILAPVIDESFSQTNNRASANSFLKIKADQSWSVSTPKEESVFTQPLKRFFPARKIISLSEILSTVNRATGFLAEFDSGQITGIRKRPPDQIFFAGIIGLGCEIGLPNIAHISKQIIHSELENTVNWYLSLANLQTANACLVNFLNRLDLPNVYRRSQSSLHTSSDGQKFAVSVDSLNANYSFKYFGQNKGVSVYSFIDERHLLFYSTVISAAEREAAYVIDGLLHNDVIKSDIHSTDTHGYTEIIFGVTYLLGLTFAPRLKQLDRQRLYSFKKRKVYEAQNFQILPDAYIDTELIAENWSDILRFVATIKLKYATASQLFKRLNSYSKQHPLYRALKEFGKIIKTIFILRYIDDPILRQSIEKQLNKIENAHKFAKAIAFGNNQEFSSGEKEEQDIIAGCRQLIENSVICWNYLYLTQKLNDANQKESQELLSAVKEGSIVTWQHINFHGEYDFSEEKLRDSVGLNLPKILSWKRDENQE
jgi:TnpA family transposase